MIWQNDDKCVGLLVLNAEDFVEIGRVVFNTPSTIPKTFHGWFSFHGS